MRTDRARLLVLIVLLLCTGLVAACSSSRQAPLTRWQGDQATVTLEYRGGARAVFAAGDWNGWKPELSPFTWRGGERWELELVLPPGEHAYLLVLETDQSRTWKADPANPDRTQDAEGRSLSLINVGTAAAVDD